MKTVKVTYQCQHVVEIQVINDALGEHLKLKAAGTLCPHCVIEYQEMFGNED